MRCPYCGEVESRVVDSRDVEGGVRRRRLCARCGLRFTTIERAVARTLYVIKKDGRREEFRREKLLGGISKACQKRPLPMGAVEKLVDEVETELYRLGRAEVPSSLIGDMVMERLKKLDHIAYIRFASVYREFRDLADLRQEVEALSLAEPVAQLPLLPNTPAPSQRRKMRR